MKKAGTFAITMGSDGNGYFDLETVQYRFQIFSRFKILRIATVRVTSTVNRDVAGSNPAAAFKGV